MIERLPGKADSPVPDFKPLTLVEVLRWRATHQGAETAYTFLLEGGEEEAALTYAELDRRARSIGASLQELRAGGRPVLLLYPPGLEYLAGFFGCLYAGAIAVPIYPPRLNRHLLRLQSILTDAQPAVALTDARSLSRLRPLLNQLPNPEGIRWVATDAIADWAEAGWREPEPRGDSLAMLQYTSGSTGAPRGVMLSHQNLMHNSALLADAFGYTSESRCVSWLPVYHDMGLIGGVIQPLYGGFPCVLMSPASFLQRPFRWLSAISRYRATLSGAPNFAYDLCVSRVTAEQRATLDLSSWGVAFDGAEPIRAETLRRFAQAFEPCGFRAQAFYPCYGLAEATLIVSGGPKVGLPAFKTVDAKSLETGFVAETDADDQRARTLVGSGKVVNGERVIVVNPETFTECPRGQVGEIWVSGPSVARGYWARPEETAHTFRAHLSDTGEGPFLRTGDLGVIEDGELFVTGRLKDLIIIRGRNHYPQDIELSVEQSHPALRPAGGAAFSIEVSGEERLVVVHELEHRKRPDTGEVIDRIRRVVAEEHELQVHGVALLRPGSIPKTSSGKIQRHACRVGFLTNSLDALAEWRETATAEAATPAPIPKPASSDKEEIEAYLASHLAALSGLKDADIDAGQTIAHYGLDSLAATELSHRIESGLGVVLPTPGLLQQHTIGELAAELAARLRESGNGDGAAAPTWSSGESPGYPLSHGQRALWFLQQAAPESTAYNVACALRLRGELSGRALRKSFRRLAERHTSLRTNFTAPGGEPLQTVQRQAALDLLEEDASRWSAEQLQDRLNREAHRPFNLALEPPMRIRLFKRSEGEHVLSLTAHHIALDFWSLGILIQELLALYAAEKSGGEAALAPLSLQYEDYVRWQRELLAGREGERLSSYWKQQLSGDLPLLRLPTDRPRPPAQTHRGASVQFRLDAGLTRRLRALARGQGTTLYTILLAAYQTLLYRYTGQKTIVVGSTAACRSRAGLAGLVGYLANPLVLRGELSGDPPFLSFLAGVRRTVLDALEHQDYPFPLLVERLQPARDPSRTPFFQVMFVLHKARRPSEDYLSLLALGGAEAQARLDGLELEVIPLEQRTSQFDLTLAMAETEHGLSGAFQYSTDLFDAGTVSRMSEHYRVLLEAITADPRRRVSELPLLTEGEREQVLRGWNETRAQYPAGKCLHQLFEEQAGRTPEAVALVYETEELTYRELNERSNRLAHHLRDRGVGAESRVGILMERSAGMVVALLAVLKAGGAYVPLDPEYPSQRLSFMLEDAGVCVLLTQEHLAGRVSLNEGAQLVCVDRGRGEIERGCTENVESEVSAANLAYVIYTSGSTGVPKGVMIPHRALVNYLSWCVKAYDVAAGSGAPLHSSIGFDLTVTSLFAPLLAGRRVLLVGAPGGESLVSALRRKGGYGFVKLTPSHLSMLGQMLTPGEAAGLTGMFIVGGEALRGEAVASWLKHAPATRIINEYGPTETAVGCCVYEVAAEAGLNGPVPIGRPIANTQLYILDEHLNPLPPGVAGELYVGGDGLARGYLNSPGLTARKFIPHPFSREAGARLYRTGDRALYRPDGNIEFLGRLDEQVKVRGYRVEPGEIEAVLGEHPGIRGAAVTVEESAPGLNRLNAYFVPANGHSPTGAEIRAHLRETLPEFMVPDVFIKLDELPLTAHGKVDRGALSSLEHTRPDSEGFVEPRTKTERELAEIWSQLLGVRRVGVHDNFFELGGHSLLAAQIISRARDAFGVELPLPTLLKSPTVAQLAEAIEGGAVVRRSKITPVARAHRRATLSEDGATVLPDVVKGKADFTGDGES